MFSRAFAKVAGRCFVRLALAAATMLALFPFTARAQGVGKQMLHGHVPPAVARLHLPPMNRLPATNRLDLAIGLPLRNQDALNKLLAEIYDPASTNYHRYLTPEQFTAQFGPTEQDYQSLIHFAQTNGLTVTATYPNRVLLDVSGSAASVERVFHVKLNVYRHPAENRLFFAPDAEPSIDLSVPVLHVGGLDNFSIPRPAIFKKNPLNNKPAGVSPALGSGPSGNYIGNDFRAAYVPGTALNGAGQVVGLLELDGYYANDITTYESLAGLPNVTLTNVLVDGVSGSPGYSGIQDAVTEVSLDIEMAISMATNLSKVIVYEGNPNTTPGVEHILQIMAANNVAKQISSSWVFSDDPVNDASYKQMAAQGQSFFQASGDNDAYYSGISQSADDTNITLVGGTTLSTTGPGGAWSSETVWNWGYDANISPPGYVGSGGGVNLNNVPIPTWQTGINMTTNQGSTTLRNVPDVALTADNIFVEANNGQQITGVGGTSAAAPLWAAFTALINQQAVLVGKPTVGFLNPAICAIGKGPNYALDFHDITTGNNTNANSANKYFAAPGYDLCTGWGTPNGQNLINDLVTPDTLGILPANGFNAAGKAGGPFSPVSQNFFLTNSGAGPLAWSLINTSAWLNATATGGTLATGATTNIIISLTAAATNLPVGSYAANVSFTNWNTHVVQSLQFNLQVQQPLVVTPATGFTSGGPGGGPFSVTTQNFTLTNTGVAPLNWTLINTSAWLNATGGGTLAPGATATATVNLASAATNLAPGTYTASVWATNQTNGGAQPLPFTLLVNLLIQNGGFETGDFTGWTLNEASGTVSIVDNGSNSGISPHSGTYFAALGHPSTLGYLTQTVPTVANQAYLLSLWLKSPNAATASGGLVSSNTPNEFSVSWNGNTLFDQTNIPQIRSWTNLQFIVTASGTGTVLQFGERVDPWYLGLDDVSVTPIPAATFQPSTVMKTNNNFTMTWPALTGLVYQVQFKTNLLQTNWVVLKSITATNTVITFVDTNPVTGSPQKFYRLRLLP
jgi:hypothetical protein